MAEKKKAVWKEVKCMSHGRSSSDPNIPPSVRVGFKGTRSEKTAGCPMCKKEMAMKKS